MMLQFVLFNAMPATPLRSVWIEPLAVTDVQETIAARRADDGAVESLEVAEVTLLHGGSFVVLDEGRAVVAAIDRAKIEDADRAGWLNG